MMYQYLRERLRLMQAYVSAGRQLDLSRPAHDIAANVNPKDLDQRRNDETISLCIDGRSDDVDRPQ